MHFCCLGAQMAVGPSPTWAALRPGGSSRSVQQKANSEDTVSRLPGLCPFYRDGGQTQRGQGPEWG